MKQVCFYSMLQVPKFSVHYRNMKTFIEYVLVSELIYFSYHGNVFILLSKSMVNLFYIILIGFHFCFVLKKDMEDYCRWGLKKEIANIFVLLKVKLGFVDKCFAGL